jgi:hypothetical protein
MQNNLASFHVHGLKHVSWTWIPFFEQICSMILCTCSSYRTYKKQIQIKRWKLLNIANKDKMTPILNMYIVWVYVDRRKSLDSKMWSFFWKIHREQCQNSHWRCNALGESAPCVVCISSPRARYAWLSANLTDGDDRYGCGGGAVSWVLRREPDHVLSAKRGFTESWSFGSRRSSWLTVKTLFPVMIYLLRIFIV